MVAGMGDDGPEAEAVAPVARPECAIERNDVEAVADRDVAHACRRIGEVDLVMHERELPRALSAPVPRTAQVSAQAGAPRARPALTQAIRLIGADVVIADDLAPALEVLRDDFLEARIGQPGRLETELAQPRGNLGGEHGGARVGGDLLQERRRRSRWGEEAVPGFDADAGEHAVEG